MSHVQKPGILGYAGKILLAAAGSYIFGKIGQNLAVPPVYATILWPPSGIALGIMLAYGLGMWPSVFISAIFLNSPFAEYLLYGTQIDIAKVWTPLVMATGACLQAVAVTVVLRRYFNLPVAVNSLKDALIFLLIAAPLGCAISPTAGVAALYFSGTVPASALLVNWLTWWAGDTFGIIVFMPLTLLCTGSLSRVFALRPGSEMMPAITLLALVIPLCVTLAAWKTSTTYALGKAQSQFKHLTYESERALQHRIDSYEQGLYAGLGLFAGSASITRNEWRNFATAIGVSSRLAALQGIGYIADVRPDELAEFTRVMREEGDASYNPGMPNAAGEYFIIKFIEPADLNGVAFGMNIAQHAVRRDAAIASRDSGSSAMTGRISLLQKKNQGAGFLLLLPHYANNMPRNTVEERRAAIRGWVYAPFSSNLFLSGLTVSQGVDFNIFVYDGDTNSPGDLVYASGDARPGALFRVTNIVEVRQQKWRIVWESTPGYERRESSNEALIILVSGLLFTGMLGVFLLVQAQRHTAVEHMVETRTAELTEREAHLAQVVDKLTESNVELERFAYVVSHDMQEPIRMVANFSSLLWHQYQDKFDPAGEKYLSIISDGARRLQAMVSDLLEYARVGQGTRGREQVNAETLLQYVLENLNFVIYEREAEVTHDPLPSFQGYPVQFMSLLQNLINNAIKYQPKGAHARVHVSARDEGKHFLFSVRDNGIGISEENRERIFEPFKRLHSFQEYAGTGLGLSVAKKIVANHGGTIWVDSAPGEGSTFWFTVMK